MDERNLYSAYALALALAPDPNVAGDLFAAARDTHDLRRRLERWRRQRGLPPGPEQPELPLLDAAQREHALHLWRQTQRRRRLAPALAAAGGALLLAALLVGGRSYLADRTSLARDPAFSAAPIATAATGTGVQFAVYRAEATPARVSVWWGLSGPGARAYAAGAAPQLFPRGFSRRRQAAGSETAVLRGGRVLGKTTYPGQGLWRQAILILQAPADGQQPLRVDFPVSVQDEPGTRVITPAATAGGVAGARVEQVRIAPSYVAVRSHIVGGMLAQRLELQVDGKPVQLNETQVLDRGDGSVRESLFPPLPPGASHLQVRYLLGLIQPFQYELAQPPVRHSQRTTAGFTATIALPRDQVVWPEYDSDPRFIDAQRRSYPIESIGNAPDPADPGQILYTFTASVPPQFEPFWVSFQSGPVTPLAAVPVDLG